MIAPAIVRVWAGTSGFAYDEWRGPFYPEDLKDSEMLAYYASRLETVEINNTFYRMPKPEMLAAWAGQVAEGFRFALKAPRPITHIQRLKEPAESVSYLFATVASLGSRLGPVLFQLPPNLKADLPRLEAFLACLPEGTRAALEFRHSSWQDTAVQALLAARGVALVAADGDDEEKNTPLVATADWGYLRLRRTDYGEEALKAWADAVRRQPWKEAFVYFKHEDQGSGPRLAARFLSLAGALAGE